VVIQTTSPAGVAFFVRRQHSGLAEFRVELVARNVTDLPAVVSIRFPAGDRQRLLLVPLAAQPLGPPAAQAELPGLASGVRWESTGPVAVEQAPNWDQDVVRESVRVAANEATRDAWREVRDRVGGTLGEAIDRELR
jgi:hypothetical protein